MIEAKSVTKIYGKSDHTVVAVNDLHLELDSSERAAIIGKSGSGKSTLLNLLAGLDHPTSGCLTVDGRNLDRMRSIEMAQFRRESVGMIFQSFQLIPQRTAMQNAELPLTLQGLPRRTRQQAARDWLERVGLGHRLHHFPYELSGGEQQRVAIARALVHQPGLLLADEPTGNLDSSTSAHVEELLIDLCRESRVTFLLVTHDIQLAKRMSNRLFSMSDGTLSELSPHEAD